MIHNDTIAALSTPRGKGAISIIRISGKRALNIAEDIFDSKIEPFRTNFGKINIGNKDIDRIILLYFKKPKSYTGEDLIEFHTHGSNVIIETILNYCFRKGVRPAKAGEFTLRAFINGKIDMIQAEAINNIINSNTLKEAEISFSQMEGSLSDKLKRIKKLLKQSLANIEASIDFPDYEIILSRDKLHKNLKEILKYVNKLISSHKYGQILKDGYNVVLTGKANVGKSSLLNSIVQEERAIVSKTPGTTRDFLRESFLYNNTQFNIIDVAGIEDSNTGTIEKKGVEKALEIIEKNDNILFMLDGAEKIDNKDISIYEKIKEKNIILIINKIDKGCRLTKSQIYRKFPNIKTMVKISAKKEINISGMLDLIESEFIETKMPDDGIIMSFRQKQAFQNLADKIKKTIKNNKEKLTEEIIAEGLRDSIKVIEKLTGKISSEEIIEEIFSNFCVGK